MTTQYLQKEIPNALDKYVNNAKAFELLKACSENTIFMKIKFKHDVIEFLRYLKEKKNYDISKISAEINKIIDISSPNYEELVEKVYKKYLKKESNRIRLEYSLYMILPYTKNLLNDGKKYSNLEKAINEYLKSDISNENEENIFESLNEIFLKSTGRDFNYFERRNSNVIDNQYIIRLFKKWKARKFTIEPRVYRKKKITPENIPKYNTTITGNVPNLQQLHKFVTMDVDRTLQRDKEMIKNVISEYNKDMKVDIVQNFWEMHMFKYIKDNNNLPRENTRNGLLVITCWIYVIKLGNDDFSIEDMIKIFTKLGYHVESTSEAIKIYTKMFDKSNHSEYKEIFNENISTYRIPLENIKKYLVEKKISSSMIYQILAELQKTRSTKKGDIEKDIYRVLKPIKKVEITQKIIKTFF